MNKWKEKFDNKILRRGYQYYLQGRVIKVSKNKNRINAIVEGNLYYHTSITINNNKLIQLHCTCPYENKNNHCKHEAALLYEYENGIELNKEENLFINNNPRLKQVDIIDKKDSKLYFQYFISELNKIKTRRYNTSEIGTLLHGAMNYFINLNEYQLAIKAIMICDKKIDKCLDGFDDYYDEYDEYETYSYCIVNELRYLLYTLKCNNEYEIINNIKDMFLKENKLWINELLKSEEILI